MLGSRAWSPTHLGHVRGTKGTLETMGLVHENQDMSHENHGFVHENDGLSMTTRDFSHEKWDLPWVFSMKYG